MTTFYPKLPLIKYPSKLRDEDEQVEDEQEELDWPVQELYWPAQCPDISPTPLGCIGAERMYWSRDCGALLSHINAGPHICACERMIKYSIKNTLLNLSQKSGSYLDVKGGQIPY